jgi:hypothetical protein
MEEPEQPHTESSEPVQENIRRSQRNIKLIIVDDYDDEIYISEDVIYMSEDIYTKGDPTYFEEAMRSPVSFKWLMAMQDETRSMSTK